MIHPNFLDQLQMFVTAARLGTFSATAKKMGRAQNVVSYGISTLENSLGVELFDRGGHKAALTKAGEALKRQAQSIVDAAHDLSRQAAEISSGTETVLTIAIDDIIPFDFFADALSVVAESFPALEVRLNRTAGHAARNQVERKQADIGLSVPSFSPEKSFTYTMVGEIRMVPVAGPGLIPSEVGMEAEGPVFDAAGYRQIVLSASETPEASPDQGVFSPLIWRVPDLKTKHDLIRRGYGWGMLPHHSVREEIEDGRLIELSTIYYATSPALPVIIFGLTNSPRGPVARLFWQTVVNDADAHY
jgi:DNA-binding transcriptional LysR family regulator